MFPYCINLHLEKIPRKILNLPLSPDLDYLCEKKGSQLEGDISSKEKGPVCQAEKKKGKMTITTTKTAEIPVIDIASGRPEGDIARALCDAAIKYGFIYVKSGGGALGVGAVERAFEIVEFHDLVLLFCLISYGGFFESGGGILYGWGWGRG